MTAIAPRLFISLSGIARLAHVKRPVVSVWRTRAATSDLPFPSPVADDRGSEVFDARQVAEWLVATGRGNNPDVLADAPAFARFDATRRGDEESFHALTALVALRAAVGSPISALDREQILDVADEVDPDDASIVSELTALDSELLSMARFVDVLVDGAFGASAAFESLLDERFRDGHRALTRTALSSEATDLVGELAIELARSNPFATPERPVFVDPTGAGGDLLIAILGALVDGSDVSVKTANSVGFGARLVRRRLLAHELPQTLLTVTDTGEFEAKGALVHVAQFPTPDSSVMTPEQILSAIENVVLQMDDAQRGVVVAPASVLIDGGLSAEADAMRSTILRSGRLRAMVRLPRGLVTSNPRQALALWVFGPAHATVAAADRWMVVADLVDESLTAATRGDLVGDLSASMGDQLAVRAHAFRFGRRVLSRTILARSGSLLVTDKPVVMMPISVPGVQHRAPMGAELAARLDRIVDTLGATAPAGIRQVSVSDSPTFLPQATLGALAASHHIRCLPGSRISDVHVGSDSGYRIIGVDEVTGSAAVGSRTIDRLVLASTYPSARLTEPGDVVFCASPRPRAVVDSAGFSVVEYPARILRINPLDAAGLVADVLVSDIGRQSASDWKRWAVRRVVAAEQAGLVRVLDSVAAERSALVERLRLLDYLTQVFVDGVAVGTLTTAGSDAAIIAPSEGTD